MVKVATTVLAAGAFVVGQAAAARLRLAEVSAPSVNITSFGINGSGCPPDSTAFSFNRDKSTLNIFFAQFFATAGPGVPISSNRKNCQLTFGLEIPQGYSFLLSTVSHKGFNHLDAEVDGTHASNYYFQGELEEQRLFTTKTGPVSGSYFDYKDLVDLKVPVKSACGATNTILNINTELRVNNRRNTTGSGTIGQTKTEIDTTFGQAFDIRLEECEAN